jgi:OmpA-OmpF porin, OOP family
MLRTSLLLTASLLTATLASAGAKRFEIVDGALVVPHPITFVSGKDSLTSESAEAIAFVADYLTEKAAISTLRIEVHADSTGSDTFNQSLTEKRSFAVGKALVARGVDCKRLIAVGFGSTKPVADNKTPEGKAKNRRTVFANAALRGKAIGGAPLDGGGKVAGDLCAK